MVGTIIKQFRKIFSILLFVVLCFGIMTNYAFAKTYSQDGIEVTLTTDKDSYVESDDIEVSLTITNTNDISIKNVSVETLIPNGIKLKSEEDLKSFDIIEPGESKVIKITCLTISGENESDITNPEKPDDESGDKETINDSNQIDTGDSTSIVLWTTLLILSIIGLIFIGRKNKSLKKFFSMFLCITLISSIIPHKSLAISTDSKIERKSISVDTDFKIDSRNYTFGVKVLYDWEVLEELSDKDKDGVSDYIEELWGTDSSKEDTDGDGLSDYIEIYKSETDPLKVDSDEDGITDANEDYDEDGITNKEELLIGTDLTKIDTDNDNLNDYEEQNKYKTDPLKYDTDEDGISDGDEILLGLDPLNPCSDGSTPDAERTFEQTLNKELIEETLTKDNLVLPSISGEVSDNINNHVQIDEVDLYALDDNRAVIGKQVHINTDYKKGSDLRLSFDCKSVEERIEYLTIFRYDDKELIPCDTKKDGNNIWTTVTEGDYFVVDVEELLLHLDIPITDYKEDLSKTVLKEEAVNKNELGNSVSSEWYEENYTFVDKNGNPIEKTDSIDNSKSTDNIEEITDLSVDDKRAQKLDEQHYVLKSSLTQKNLLLNKNKEELKISGQADIVFVIDTTGSMRGAINNVVNNITSFVDTLSSDHSVKANFALIDYKDITCDEETILVKNGSSNWFSNVNLFKSYVNSLVVTGGGDNPETAIDGLAKAHELDFRESANKFVILVTDAGYKIDNNYDISSMDEIAGMLKKDGIVTSVIAPTYYEDDYHKLYTETKGIFADIYGDFSLALLELANNIGGIVNDGSWVLLSDYQYIKLDKSLGDDADKDLISNTDELGIQKEIDLTKQIEDTLAIYGVPKELYKDKSSVTVYNYKSNPILVDTDFDGINDKKDQYPLKNNFSGKLYTSEAKSCDINFTVDYRKFFKDNKVYDKDLAVLSSLYAADIYNTKKGKANKVTVTSVATDGTDNNTTLPKIFGFENVEHIKVESENSIDIDDATEIVLGHRTVEYNGEKRKIILLSVQGTDGTNAKWSSNFDVGADTADYYDKVGYSHPDWKNKNNHKGFDVTANRVLKEFDKYIKKYKINSSDNKTILITGHSRGGAIANILGAHFENKPNYKSFTYTFASPYTTTDKDVKNYKTIMNIMNKDDLVAYLPLEKWGFKKYGTMKIVSVADDGLEDKSPFGDKDNTFESLFGEDYNNDGGTERTLSAFLKCAGSREALYILDSSNDGKVNIKRIENISEKRAQEIKVELEEELRKYKLEKFCKLNVKKIRGVYNFEVNYCPAYLLQDLANLSGKSGIKPGYPMLGYDVKGKYHNAKNSFIASSGKVELVSVGIGGMEHPHMPGTYYLISSVNKFTNKKVEY